MIENRASNIARFISLRLPNEFPKYIFYIQILRYKYVRGRLSSLREISSAHAIACPFAFFANIFRGTYLVSGLHDVKFFCSRAFGCAAEVSRVLLRTCEIMRDDVYDMCECDCVCVCTRSRARVCVSCNKNGEALVTRGSSRLNGSTTRLQTPSRARVNVALMARNCIYVS